MEFLKEYVQAVEEEIQSLQLPDRPAYLYDPQRYILANGGKRIRPVLTLLAGGMCGRSVEQTMPAALAVELLHNFTLMHDDIMDQAENRRGKPAVHMKWDSSTAILAGDALFTRAMMQLQNLEDEVDHKKISAIFLDGINAVCEGQALDMDFENRVDVSPEEYLEMIAGKTGALLSASLQMGGIVAGADDEVLENLADLGNTLGYAFQIQDDLLDVVADPDKFGKTVAGDIVECKKTYLMVLSLEACNKDERKWLQECLNNKPIDQPKVEKVIDLYKELGIIEATKKKVDGYYSRAESILERFGESTYKQDLHKLIQTLKTREY